MGCGVQCSRAILFTLNIVFWLCGLAMLGVGLWLLLDNNAWEMLTIIEEGGMDDPLLRYAVYLIIAVGGFIMVVGFLGCTGVWKSNTCMLKLYTFLVGLVLLAEIVAGILAVIFITKIDETLETGIKDLVQQQYGEENQPTLNKAIDAVQIWLECCGSTGYKDYRNSSFAAKSNNSVPDSCCKMDGDNFLNHDKCLTEAQKPDGSSEFLNTEGCYPTMKAWAEDNIYILAGVVFGIAFIQIMGVILGCCLIRSLEADEKM